MVCFVFVAVLCLFLRGRDLDVALLRRLEKRILVPLPNERARYTMLRSHLLEREAGGSVGAGGTLVPASAAAGAGAAGQGALDYADLSRRTEGYSGSDIALLCKEAAMRPVRRLMKQLLSVDSGSSSHAAADVSSEVRLEPVVAADVRAALACTRPSAQSKYLQKYAQWHREFGAGIHDVTMDAPLHDETEA